MVDRPPSLFHHVVAVGRSPSLLLVISVILLSSSHPSSSLSPPSSSFPITNLYLQLVRFSTVPSNRQHCIPFSRYTYKRPCILYFSSSSFSWQPLAPFHRASQRTTKSHGPNAKLAWTVSYRIMFLPTSTSPAMFVDTMLRLKLRLGIMLRQVRILEYVFIQHLF